MFPLRVVLVGCSDRELVSVRGELQDQSIEIEAVFRGVDDVLEKRGILQEQPRLFLVPLQSEHDLGEAKRLRAVFTRHPILALTYGVDDPAGLLAAMRAGISQVVPLPLVPGDFKEALNCIALQFGLPPTIGRVLAVSGVAGGCGATTLAINIAHEVAQACGKRTILAELSLQMGTLVTYLDFESKFALDDLLCYTEQLDAQVIDRSLTKLNDKLSLLPGPRRPVAPSKEAQKKITGILDFLKSLAEVVIVDLPCTFDSAYFNLLRGADQVVLVGEQRIPSIRNVQLVLDTLGPAGIEKTHLAVNRYDPRLQGFTVPSLQQLLHLPRILTVTNDPERVTTALNQGQTLREAAPTSPVLADIKSLTRSVLNLGAEPVQKLGSGVFRRVFHAVGLA